MDLVVGATEITVTVTAEDRLHHGHLQRSR